MKVEVTAEEVWALAAEVGRLQAENELLRKRAEQAELDAKNSRTVIITAQFVQGLAKDESKEKIVLIQIEKMMKVLRNLDNMDQVRLVAHSMQKMLPEDAEAVMVKWITDATPERVNEKALVNLEVANANDILTGESSKFVTHNHQRKEG